MLACFYFSLKVNFKLKQLKIVLKLIPIRNHTKTDEPTNENAVPAFELWPALIVCLLAADWSARQVFERIYRTFNFSLMFVSSPELANHQETG